MQKLLFIVAVSLPLVVNAAQDDMADRYFSKTNVVLTPQEKQAIDIAKKWRAESATGIRPTAGPNGAVRYLYGAQEPSIVCAPLQVCDVSLQPGEQVNSIHLGDTVRWSIEPAVTGSGASETQHLIIKTMDVGLETSLIVTTNRRTYHMRLRSHRTQYMPQVAFTYPEDALAKWDNIKRNEAEHKANNTLPKTGEYLGDLNFNYEIDGDASWKPVRVFNDGRKTVIEMPDAMQQTEAPTLLVVRRDGGWFRDDETVMVNYRVQGDRFIVDSVFDKAILIAGVGKFQEQITISRSKK